MKKWSDNLIELSRDLLQIDGVNVKSIKGQFGKLNIEDKIYKISIKNTTDVLIFNSIDDIINSGWVVD